MVLRLGLFQNRKAIMFDVVKIDQLLVRFVGLKNLVKIFQQLAQSFRFRCRLVHF